jgi:hypothetical protein
LELPLKTMIRVFAQDARNSPNHPCATFLYRALHINEWRDSYTAPLLNVDSLLKTAFHSLLVTATSTHRNLVDGDLRQML